MSDQKINQSYVVYRHLREDTGEPVYYGQGSYGRAYNARHRTIYRNLGFRPIVEILAENLSRQEALAEEKKQILAAVKRGEKLLNVLYVDESHRLLNAEKLNYLMECSRKGGSKGGKISANQKWKCSECDMVCGPGSLSYHQKASGHQGRTRVA